MENQKRKAESEGRWCVAKAAGKFLWENQGADEWAWPSHKFLVN